MPSLAGKIKGNYQFVKEIGKGAFATVYRAIHIPSGSPVAVKAITKSYCLKPSDEFEITRKISHPAIIETFDFFTMGDSSFIVMQHLPQGTLSEFLQNQPEISRNHVKKIFIQIVSAVNYLHSEGICHRDIKPSNVLIDSDMNVKLIDFGLSVKYNANNPSIVGMCGCAHYAAPEIWENKSYSEKIDVWSLGVVLYRLLFRRRPFDDENTQKMCQNIVEGKYYLPMGTDHLLVDLFSKVLEKNPSKRISAKELLYHAWLFGIPKPANFPLIIDDSLISEIGQKGIPTDTIKEDIADQKLSGATVLYRILRASRSSKPNSDKRMPNLPRLATQGVKQRPSPAKDDESNLPQLKLPSRCSSTIKRVPSQMAVLPQTRQASKRL